MIRLLGRPTARVRVRGNKPWAITAYLALAGATSRERLATLLFEDADDPLAALRWNLAQVRRLLERPDALQGALLGMPRDQTVLFDVDVLTGPRWEDAIDLPSLGAELLEGIQFPSCAAFETWLLGERRRLAAVTETLLYEATLASLSIGDLAEAVRLAGRLVTLSPCVDAHQELLIRAYAVSGDPNAARQQLRSAVRLFRRELGSDPQPAVFLAAEVTPVRSAGPASPIRVHALIEAGRAQVAAGATDAAVQIMRTACDEARRTGMPGLEATAQLALGAALVSDGTTRHQEGELTLHRAIALSQQAGEPTVAASAYRQLAGSDVLRGAYARADRRLAAAGAAVSADADADAGVAVELAAIGGVSILDQGDIGRAITTFEQGLAADPQRTHSFLPIMLAHAGRARLLAGDPGAARHYLRESLDIARARAWAGVTAAPLALLGHAALVDSDLQAAQELLEQAFARACQIADPCWETWSAHGLGLHAEATGDDRAALEYLGDAVARSRPQRGGHLWSHVWALTDAVRIARHAGDPRAEPWHDEALNIAQRCGMRGLTDRLPQLNRGRP